MNSRMPEVAIYIGSRKVPGESHIRWVELWACLCRMPLEDTRAHNFDILNRFLLGTGRMPHPVGGAMGVALCTAAKKGTHPL